MTHLLESTISSNFNIIVLPAIIEPEYALMEGRTHNERDWLPYIASYDHKIDHYEIHQETCNKVLEYFKIHAVNEPLTYVSLCLKVIKNLPDNYYSRYNMDDLQVKLKKQQESWRNFRKSCTERRLGHTYERISGNSDPFHILPMIVDDHNFLIATIIMYDVALNLAISLKCGLIQTVNKRLTIGMLLGHGVSVQQGEDLKLAFNRLSAIPIRAVQYDIMVQISSNIIVPDRFTYPLAYDLIIIPVLAIFILINGGLISFVIIPSSSILQTYTLLIHLRLVQVVVKVFMFQNIDLNYKKYMDTRIGQITHSKVGFELIVPSVLWLWLILLNLRFVFDMIWNTNYHKTQGTIIITEDQDLIKNRSIVKSDSDQLAYEQLNGQIVQLNDNLL